MREWKPAVRQSGAGWFGAPAKNLSEFFGRTGVERHGACTSVQPIGRLSYHKPGISSTANLGSRERGPARVARGKAWAGRPGRSAIRPRRAKLTG